MWLCFANQKITHLGAEAFSRFSKTTGTDSAESGGHLVFVQAFLQWAAHFLRRRPEEIAAEPRQLIGQVVTVRTVIGLIAPVWVRHGIAEISWRIAIVGLLLGCAPYAATSWRFMKDFS